MRRASNIGIVELCQEFILTAEQCKQIVCALTDELNQGLAKKTNATAKVKCYLTFVHALPSGKERGQFLALDLGGTNFRVLMIDIKSEADVIMTSETYSIPEELHTGEGSALFDFIAESLLDFVKKNDVEDKNLPLGFTFSFPCKQNNLLNGSLVAWTKGFNCSGVVGKNVVELLHAALARQGANIQTVALLNDTTGTLMSCAWPNRNCRIGVIVGTGSNACYMEKLDNAEMFTGARGNKTHVVVNSEWGAFGDNGVLDFARTQIDKDVDALTINQSRQTFEKMISGMYLGEIVRQLIVKCVVRAKLFGGEIPAELTVPWSFLTKNISEIEADPAGRYDQCRAILEEFGIDDASDVDCAAVRQLCEVVSTRSANLVACGLAAILNKMNETDVIIGIDGSVYRYHPHYHNRLVAKLGELVNAGISFRVMLSEDGSGRGAALVAAVASRAKGIASNGCGCKRCPS